MIKEYGSVGQGIRGTLFVKSELLFHPSNVI